jgi:hypothetical protein
MKTLVIFALSLALSTTAFSRDVPTVQDWRNAVQVASAHPLFKGLTVKVDTAPIEALNMAPVATGEMPGVDCVVYIAEGDNPRLALILALAPTSGSVSAFVEAIAAHELGHCLRIRSKHLTTKVWALVSASSVGSDSRKALELQISREEAYADAYALVYVQDAHPAVYSEVFKAFHGLRHEPTFRGPFYQVQGLYRQVTATGLGLELPLEARVEDIMQRLTF